MQVWLHCNRGLGQMLQAQTMHCSTFRESSSGLHRANLQQVIWTDRYVECFACKCFLLFDSITLLIHMLLGQFPLTQPWSTMLSLAKYAPALMVALASRVLN